MSRDPICTVDYLRRASPPPPLFLSTRAPAPTPSGLGPSRHSGGTEPATPSGDAFTVAHHVVPVSSSRELVPGCRQGPDPFRAQAWAGPLALAAYPALSIPRLSLSTFQARVSCLFSRCGPTLVSTLAAAKDECYSLVYSFLDLILFSDVPST